MIFDLGRNKMKFSNYFCLVAFVWSIASPANAQDLGGLFKQLEDTLNSANQGQTNQSSNSSGSGATGGLGGLLNSLQQMDQSSSGSNAEPNSGAKEIATSNKTINFICKRQALPDIYKKLAKPNLKNLEQSFGKSASQIASIISTDTPPSLGLLSINAMCAANWVMVPVQAEYYALEGFSMLMNSIKMIQRRINRNLKIFGIAMTMVDARSKLSRHVCDEVNKKMPNKLFKTTIRHKSTCQKK